MTEESVGIVVVGNKGNNLSVRCIYINNYRIVGSKPYISEDLPQREWHMTLKEFEATGLTLKRRLPSPSVLALVEALEKAEQTLVDANGLLGLSAFHDYRHIFVQAIDEIREALSKWKNEVEG